MLKTQVFLGKTLFVGNLPSNYVTMKRLFTFLIGITAFGFAHKASAQAFTVTADTEFINYPVGLVAVHDPILVPGSTITTINWKIDTANSDFPRDWMFNTSSGTTFCDLNLCYPNSIDTSGSTQICSCYNSTSTDFHMNIDLDSATTIGTHYITVKFNNTGSLPLTTATETFVVTKAPVSVPVVHNVDEVLLYPNPATSSVNIVYSANLDVKNVAIYNIIGKMQSIYKVAGNSANMNTENLNSGIYLIRLINSHGDVVLTRKFTKQ